MKNIKTPIMNGVIMALSFFVTLSLTYVTYGYVSGLGGKTSGNNLNSSDWNSLVANVDEVKSSTTIPTGFVGSFNLATCPTGWSEYTLARGRFIRGIDSTGVNDSVRVAGNTQADELKSHSHSLRGVINAGSNREVKLQLGNTNTDPTTNSIASSVGGTETRPKNVALLFCEKN